MNLKIKKYLECSEKENRIIKKIYEQSFPENEKFEFDILVECSKESSSKLNAIFLKDTVIGMSYIVNYKDENLNTISYLMYLAIDENYRNKGYASLYLKDLKTNGNLILSIEKPDELNSVKQRRKEFYLRNGFFDTSLYFEDMSVVYEVLTSIKDYVPSEETMLNRYRKMSENKKMILKIMNSFNVENLNFKYEK